MPDVVVGLVLAPPVVAGILTLALRHVRRHPDEFLKGRFIAGVVVRFVMVGMHLVIGYVIYKGAMDFVGWWGLAFSVWDIFTDANARAAFFGSGGWYDDNFQNRLQVTTAALILLTMGLVGTNIVAIFVVASTLAAVAAYWFYRSFETVAPDVGSRRRYAWLIFLFPSFTFWSVMLGKDVYIIIFMGLATLMLARLLERIRLPTLLAFGFALVMVTFLRPHIGAVLGLAAVAAFVARPLPLSGPTVILRPLIRAVIAGGVALGFVQVARRTFSAIGMASLSIEALAERAYETHQGFATSGGGAALELALASASPWDVAKFLPFGVFTLLFRPFVWEAHNAIAFATALENAAFMGLVAWRLRSFWYGVRLARTRPLMVYALVGMLAGAVVLSVEWNLGALVRHRAMVMPFVFMFLALPRERGAPLPERRP
jgi:hypothetical protein